MSAPPARPLLTRPAGTPCLAIAAGGIAVRGGRRGAGSPPRGAAEPAASAPRSSAVMPAQRTSRRAVVGAQFGRVFGGPLARRRERGRLVRLLMAVRQPPAGGSCHG